MRSLIKKPRVLQVLDSLGMGGAETWLMEVLRLWAKSKDAQMDFLITSGQSQIFDEEARRLGAKTHYLRYGRDRFFAFAGNFRRILHECQYDAIHDHQDYVSGWHFLMGGKALPPIRITHVHNPAYQIRNNYGVTFSRRLASSLGKSLVRCRATHIAGTSRQVLKEYGFDEPEFSRIPKAALYCGFDPSRFLGDVREARAAVCREFGWSEGSKIILFAGRMDASPEIGAPQNHKNSGFAVSVGIECARRDPDACMLFVGAPSSALAVFESRLAAAGLAGRIRFAGIRKDIERLMLGSDVLFFPSRGEGLGMVAVEAQAAGLPVLASTAVPRECVVLPELVRFESLETPQAVWAATLSELCKAPRNVPLSNQQVALSDFAIKNSCQALLELYKKRERCHD